MSSDDRRASGLDALVPLLAELWGVPVAVGPVRTVLGRLSHVGGSRPEPSSAVRLEAGGHAVWLPAPAEAPQPEQGLAPLYLHAGQVLVMPTVRLFAGDEAEGADPAAPEYLALSHWLLNAFTRWRFPRAGAEDGTACVLDRLRGLRRDPEEDLAAVARVVRFALFGADRVSTVAGLRLPRGPMWCRPVGPTKLARLNARSLVITARLAGPADEAGPLLPSTLLRAAAYRIRPTAPQDWGIDPVHTPEGTDIRLTGHLGVGVGVSEGRRLTAPGDGRLPLSASTSRLPFAGYDDPRRLLMAANMQAHAVPLAGQEEQPELPRVRQDLAGAEPPGVNLRVAYLAWRGWNHEDAWVLSESAARRLGAWEDVTQTVAVPAVEMPPQVLVSAGQAVERGEPLVRRFLAPALLAPSLGALARLPDLDEQVELAPAAEDRAAAPGRVVRVEEWDFLGGRGIPPDWEVPEALTGAFRAVYRFHLRRELPLAVGDKLANRHGHKGIVGAILLDDDMPRWRGAPLEALIDPISVLNRSNWGQVYEALAGASADGPVEAGSMTGAVALERARERGADEHGRWPIEPPARPGWLTEPLRAVAGVQFVMRLPHHAAEKISGSPAPPGRGGPTLRRRAQRFGEMDRWALWAHGLGGDGPTDGPLSAPVRRLGRLLASAGFELGREGAYLSIRRLRLEEEPPPGAVPLPLEGERLRDTFDRLEQVEPGPLTVLVFDPPLVDVLTVWREPGPAGPGAAAHTPRQRASVRWLPVLPACDRPPCRLPDGSEEPHDLTRALRRVVRAARKRAECARESGPAGGAVGPAEGADDLRYAVQQLLEDSYALAVGLRATGMLSGKQSLLRRGVLGHPVSSSGRATATPAGPPPLGLDEIGLPPALARAVLGPDLPRDDEALARAVKGRWVWLKRDPVLHRWGLLPLRVRLAPGDTICLPASLLGPLGADFDGDTLAVFARPPGAPADPGAWRPSALAWDPVLGRAMFVPGKQYQYGLHLLARDADRLEELNADLRRAKAPPWPGGPRVGDDWAAWLRAGAAAEPDGRWWAVIEGHALRALATEPDMGFGLFSVQRLADLPAVRCGAAKDLYQGDRAREAAEQILAGKSLAGYHLHPGQPAGPPDPIAGVMVAGKVSIGRFGGALRRLLYAAPALDPAFVRDAQCLTEQATQKALSVKAGKAPLRFGDYERQLRRLLAGEPPDLSAGSEIAAVLAPLKEACERLRAALGKPIPAWLEWLRKPHELAALLAGEAEGVMRLPPEDLRLRGWLEAP